MSKVGKDVLKQRPPKPRPLTKAELKALEEWQERMRELDEEKRAKRLERDKLKEEVPSGIVEPKEERLKELAPVLERLSTSPPPREKTEKEEEEGD